MTDRRFPDYVYRAGEDPDPRFTLANERTFLAWARTALALIAGGVALETIELPMPPGLQFAAALVLLILGVVAAALAFAGWMRRERAMRLGEPLPGTFALVMLAGGIVVAGTLIAIGVMLA
ncbi:YidH family protein [Rarobacter faecitabidus]|uniref:YidH family protein n=1 Tax=Rarobacter faecitabidus TaxID=13243 RepID=UPI00114FCD67|nr:DUF202 domain-containing protein [Rarobacter faecitabidus]